MERALLRERAELNPMTLLLATVTHVAVRRRELLTLNHLGSQSIRLPYWLRLRLGHHSGRHHAHELGELAHQGLRIHSGLARIVVGRVLVVGSLGSDLDGWRVVIRVVIATGRSHRIGLHRRSE